MALGSLTTKHLFFCFFRCLHWVDIQYLDTYFGFICFRMAWNNGVSEISTRRVHPVIYHLPSIFCTQRFGFVCFYLVSPVFHELMMIYIFVISFIVTHKVLYSGSGTVNMQIHFSVSLFTTSLKQKSRTTGQAQIDETMDELKTRILHSIHEQLHHLPRTRHLSMVLRLCPHKNQAWSCFPYSCHLIPFHSHLHR